MFAALVVFWYGGYIIDILLKVMFLSLCMVNVVYAEGFEGLGRLFTSNEQRQAMQHLRELGVQEKPEIIEVTDKPPPKISGSVHVKGIVYREDGRHVAWINEGSTLEEDWHPPASIKLEQIGTDYVEITIPKEGVEQRIKVGETLNYQHDKSLD